jgi:DNA-directed RNA polymerase specialized sigma24 family protein
MELRIDSAADQNILSALREGDRRQAARLMVLYHGVAVYEQCLALVQEQEAAEDLTQATFKRAFADLSQLLGESSPRDWLLEVARTCSNEHLGARQPDGQPSRTAQEGERLSISESLRRRLEVLASAV